MKLFCRIAGGLSRVGAWLAVALMFVLVGHILLEIFLRAFLDSSTYMLDEIGGFIVAAMTFLALGEAIKKGSLIRVNLLLSHLGPKSLKFVEALGLIATFSVIGVSLFLALEKLLP